MHAIITTPIETVMADYWRRRAKEVWQPHLKQAFKDRANKLMPLGCFASDIMKSPHYQDFWTAHVGWKKV